MRGADRVGARLQAIKGSLLRPGLNQPGAARLACFSLSHKRRASVRAGLMLGILGYAAELPFPAA